MTSEIEKKDKEFEEALRRINEEYGEALKRLAGGCSGNAPGDDRSV